MVVAGGVVVVDGAGETRLGGMIDEATGVPRARSRSAELQAAGTVAAVRTATRSAVARMVGTVRA